MSKKKKYRVKDGYKFGAGHAHQGGDVVELTEEEAQGFLDKLTPLEKHLEDADESYPAWFEKMLEGGAEITDPAETVEFTDDELRAFNGIGPKTVKEIREEHPLPDEPEGEEEPEEEGEE